MTTDEELLTSSLRMLGDGGLEDAELERRVSQFQGALRRLRDDPAEATRVDALVMDAELGQSDVKALGSGIGVKPARTAARQGQADTSTSRAAYSPMSEPSAMLGAAINLPDDVAAPPGDTDWLEAVIDHLQKARQAKSDGDLLMVISHLHQGGELYPRALAQAVEEAREAGKTWKEIAIFAGEKNEGA